MSGGNHRSKSRILGPFFFFFFLLSQDSSWVFWARTSKLSQVIALWMRTGGMHLEFWCARRQAMSLERGYAIVCHWLALVFYINFLVAQASAPAQNVREAVPSERKNLVLLNMFFCREMRKIFKLDVTSLIWSYGVIRLSQLFIYLSLSIRHTPSTEYYVPGSPQHAVKVRG